MYWYHWVFSVQRYSLNIADILISLLTRLGSRFLWWQQCAVQDSVTLNLQYLQTPPLPASCHRIKERLRWEASSGAHLLQLPCSKGLPRTVSSQWIIFFLYRDGISPVATFICCVFSHHTSLCRKYLYLLCIYPLATGRLPLALPWAFPALGWTNPISSMFLCISDSSIL